MASDGATYVGGFFDRYGPLTGGFADISRATGRPNLQMPTVDGDVWVVLPDGIGGVYIGGSFTGVGGYPRRNLAHIQANGTVSPWAPETDGRVRALVRDGNRLFIGGELSHVGGLVRHGIAAVDATSGAVLAWDAGVPDLWVYTMATHGGSLYAGTNTVFVGGNLHGTLFEFDLTTGMRSPWDPHPGSLILDMEVVGDTLYLAGQFSNFYYAVTRQRLAAFDLTTRTLLEWDPSANSEVGSIQFSGGLLYVAGDFTSIGGQPRVGLAALDPVSGVPTAWAPPIVTAINNPSRIFDAEVFGGQMFVGGRVRVGTGSHGLAAFDLVTGGLTWTADVGDTAMVFSIVPTADSVLAGGNFRVVGGSRQKRLAAFEPTGALIPWNPEIDGTVLELVEHNGELIAGGFFEGVGGVPRYGLATFDLATRVLTPWAPSLTGAGFTGSADALLVVNDTLYVGGYFEEVDGHPRLGLAAFDLATRGVTPWDPATDPYGWVRVMSRHGSTLYLSGSFYEMGGQPRQNLAAVDLGSGAVLPWAPEPDFDVESVAVSPDGSVVYAGGMFENIGGAARNRVAALDPVTGSALAWNPDVDGEVNVVLPDAAGVHIGGWFTTVGSTPRAYYALLDATTGAVTGSDLRVTATVESIEREAGRLRLGGYFLGVNGANFGHLYLQGDPPGTPGIPMATAGNASATITVVPPAAGWAVASYTITGAPGGSCVVTPPGLSCTVTGLTNGTPYTFTVVASNIWGVSVPSLPSEPVIPIGPQAITFAPVTTQELVTGSVALSVSASSGLPVTLVSLTPPVCDVSGTSATLLAVGTCMLRATQTGSAGWTPATPVTRSFAVQDSRPGRPGVPTAVAGNTTATVTITPPSTGGAVVSYTVTGASGGSCVITVPATSCVVTGLTNGTAYTFTTTAVNALGTSAISDPSSAVTPTGPQTITFASVADQELVTGSVALSVAASSGLPVTLVSLTPLVCSVSGTTATLLAVGTCTLQATQGGNAAFTAAPPETRSFAVADSSASPTPPPGPPPPATPPPTTPPPATPPPAPTPSTQVIAMPEVPDQWLADGAVAWTAAATSGLPVLVQSLTPSTCTVEAGTTRFLSVGPCMLRASQDGGGGWSAAAVVDRVFQIRPTVLSPEAPTRDAAAAGAEGAVTLAVMPASAVWQATSSAPWVEVVGGGTGPGTLTYRVRSNEQPGARTAVITIRSAGTVATVTVRQQPYGTSLRVTDVGNEGLVTVQWMHEGPSPRDFVLVAGLEPGGVALERYVGTALIFTYVAPPGRHFVRIYGAHDTTRQTPSNEVEVLVQMPRPPSTPVDLVATVQQQAVHLGWRNTFGGGEPADVVLHVSGTFALQMPIGRRNQISFDGVPPGVYTLQVQAVNPHGSSGLSNPVTVRIGDACTAPPAAPEWLGVGVMGSYVTVLWDAGPTAAPDYELLVEGIGAFRSGGARFMSGMVGPGRYTLSVAGVNACGVGVSSPRRTVVVQ